MNIATETQVPEVKLDFEKTGVLHKNQYNAQTKIDLSS